MPFLHNYTDLTAVAAPIFNRQGKVAAALSVSGPSNRLTPEVMKQIAAPIMEAATRMGKMIK
ncbi:IclR family transcriptional regulator domain-containing protein [Brevibacillus marinus]|uniref:IclR family transcriptional regulator domain-containing protein n=1 Tax=Brevibacillus marinus TaxID=2496837 RepID=UPI000F81FA8C|nr:IclR family transcriptional regulator C-terminal domain-containing protein [Brevibacillus marinus]